MSINMKKQGKMRVHARLCNRGHADIFVQLSLMHPVPILLPEDMVVPANQFEKPVERSTYFAQKKENCKVRGARYIAAQMPSSNDTNGWQHVKRRPQLVAVPTTEKLRLQVKDGSAEDVTITWLPDHAAQDGQMRSFINKVQRLLQVVDRHYSQVRRDVGGRMVGIGQHVQSNPRCVCFHRATKGYDNMEHKRKIEGGVAAKLADLAPMFHNIFGHDMGETLSCLQQHHPHRLWLQKFLAHWIGSIDLTNAPHCDQNDSTNSFAIWVREHVQDVNEPAWFLLEEYGVAIQLSLVAIKWNGLKVRHCSFTAPPPIVNEQPNRLFSLFVSGSRHLDFQKDSLYMFNNTACPKPSLFLTKVNYEVVVRKFHLATTILGKKGKSQRKRNHVAFQKGVVKGLNCTKGMVKVEVRCRKNGCNTKATKPVLVDNLRFASVFSPTTWHAPSLKKCNKRKRSTKKRPGAKNRIKMRKTVGTA